MGSTLDKELQARRNAESRIVFPRKEHANMLSNSKRSALKTGLTVFVCGSFLGRENYSY